LVIAQTRSSIEYQQPFVFVSKTDQILQNQLTFITLVLDKESCHPELSPPKKENGSNGINLHNVLTRIVL